MPRDHFRKEKDEAARRRRARDIREQRQREDEAANRARAPFIPGNLTEEMEARYQEEARERLKKAQIRKWRPEVNKGAARVPTHFVAEFHVQPVGLTGEMLADLLRPSLADIGQDASLRELETLAGTVKHLYEGGADLQASNTLNGRGMDWSINWDYESHGMKMRIRMPAKMYCDFMAKHEPGGSAKRLPADLPPKYQERWQATLARYEAVRQQSQKGPEGNSLV